VCEKVSEHAYVIIVDRLENFGHRCIVGMPRSALVRPHRLEEVILALVCEPWHVFLSGKIGSMADIAMILFRERVAACKGLRISCLGGRPGRWKLGEHDGHVLEIIVAQSFRIFIHRRRDAQPLAKHKELN